jgi:hypothetical protein
MNAQEPAHAGPREIDFAAFRQIADEVACSK